MTRTSVVPAALVLLLATSAAQAQENAAPAAAPPPMPGPLPVQKDAAGEWTVLPSGHAAFALGGGGGGPDGTQSGFRLGLDASLGVLFAAPSDRKGAWTIAPSVVTGFGKYATYTSLDVGRVFFVSDKEYGALGGAIVTVGPALRVDPSTAVGVEASARLYFFFLQAGVRAIAIASNGGEAQVEATLGVGLF